MSILLLALALGLVGEPVEPAEASRDFTALCEARWAAGDLHLGMTLGDFKDSKPDFVYRRSDTDGHRVQNTRAGHWYRWTVDDGLHWNYVLTGGHASDSPVLSMTLSDSFPEWRDRDLDRRIDEMSQRWGPPQPRHVPLDTTRYHSAFGTPKRHRKWMATVWEDERCDAAATVMYRRTRDHFSDRVTLFHVALTSISEDLAGPEFARVSAPDYSDASPTSTDGDCSRWRLDRLDLGMTLGEIMAAHPKKPFSQGGRFAKLVKGRPDLKAWSWPHEHGDGYYWTTVYPERAQSDSPLVWIRASFTGSLEVLKELWGDPVAEEVPAAEDPISLLSESTPEKGWSTVWEDRKCGVGATARSVSWRDDWFMRRETLSVSLYSLRKLPGYINRLRE